MKLSAKLTPSVTVSVLALETLSYVKQTGPSVVVVTVSVLALDWETLNKQDLAYWYFVSQPKQAQYTIHCRCSVRFCKKTSPVLMQLKCDSKLWSQVSLNMFCEYPPSPPLDYFPSFRKVSTQLYSYCRLNLEIGRVSAPSMLGFNQASVQKNSYRHHSKPYSVVS